MACNLVIASGHRKAESEKRGPIPLLCLLVLQLSPRLSRGIIGRLVFTNMAKVVQDAPHAG